MVAKQLPDLKAAIDAAIPDNVTRLVNPADVRATGFTDAIDSLEAFGWTTPESVSPLQTVKVGTEVEIQAAMDANQSVHLRPGSTYTINNPLVANLGQEIIGHGATLLAGVGLTRFINIAVDRVDVSGVRFLGAASDRVIDMNGVSDCRITSNWFDGASIGIRAVSSLRCTISNNKFTNYTMNQIVLRFACVQNTIANNALLGSPAQPIGNHSIDIEANLGETISENNLVSNNTVASFGTPIQFTGQLCQNNQIIGNILINTSGDTVNANGMKMDTAHDNVITGNIISGPLNGIFDAGGNLYMSNRIHSEKNGISISEPAVGSAVLTTMVGNCILGLETAPSRGISTSVPNGVFVDNIIDNVDQDGFNAENILATGIRISGGRISKCGRHAIRIDADDYLIQNVIVEDCTGTVDVALSPLTGGGNAGTVMDIELINNTSQRINFAPGATGIFVRTRDDSWLTNLNAANIKWIPPP